MRNDGGETNGGRWREGRKRDRNRKKERDGRKETYILGTQTFINDL